MMRDTIDRLVQEGKVEPLIGLLATAHTPGVRYTVKRLIETNGRDSDLIEQATQWAARTEPIARHVACGLLAASYRTFPQETASLLLSLAADPDWTVREQAGTLCGQILEQDFSGGMEILHEWRNHKSPNVRRAMLIAVMKAAQARRLGWGEPLLKLVEPLLSDRDPVVRKALGPLLLGSVLLHIYPDITFEYLVKWSTANDEQTLWNVAMAFSASAALPLAKKALIVLRKLSLDERRYVWRAVTSAMWKLGRKRPEVIRPELARWLEDERRVAVAREALKHL